MDVVYILGKGSQYDDEELRYSLRSLCINMLDLHRVIVVGEKPSWLKDVHHIPCEDRHEKRWKNALEKTRMAATAPGITDEFLLMNDDFFALKPFNGADMPFYAVKNGNGGCNGKNDFSIHAPIRFKCDWYEKLPLSLDMSGDWSPRSFYANFYQAPPTFVPDLILRAGEGMPSYDEQVKKAPWFSITDGTMTFPEFVLWLHDKYPRKSKFET